MCILYKAYKLCGRGYALQAEGYVSTLAVSLPHTSTIATALTYLQKMLAITTANSLPVA